MHSQIDIGIISAVGAYYYKRTVEDVDDVKDSPHQGEPSGNACIEPTQNQPVDQHLEKKCGGHTNLPRRKANWVHPPAVFLRLAFLMRSLNSLFFVSGGSFGTELEFTLLDLGWVNDHLGPPLDLENRWLERVNLSVCAKTDRPIEGHGI